MNYSITEKNTCCFTGHRKIEFDYSLVNNLLTKRISEAITDRGITHFIAGGAIGFDTIAAEAIIRIKSEKSITLEIAIPFVGQSKLWNAGQQERYNKILSFADKITIVCPSYHKLCYQMRNQYMVNASSLIIAHFCGSSGGTKNTINYAKSKNKTIIDIFSDYK